MNAGNIHGAALKPVLVTGAPRSGTTWVGRMLALAPQLNYLHEPFNPDMQSARALCNVKFDCPFTYICEENEAKYHVPIRRMLEGRYDWFYGLSQARSWKDVSRSLAMQRAFARHRRAGGVPLVKDPIALMSAEWLAQRFDIHCIVMIRHPAAFVASMKRLGWASKPERWALSQPLLMQNYLHPFQQQIEQLKNGEHDVIERASLAWKMHHYMILQYQARHRDWIFLRHEDISRQPVPVFQGLYERLGLPFTDEISATIGEHSDGKNLPRVSSDKSTIRLNSRANIAAWKDKLSGEEVLRIREAVKEVADHFYSDHDWHLDSAEREVVGRDNS